MPHRVDVVHVDVEGRLVELDHVDPVGSERARLLVQALGERHRQLHAVAVVAVGDRVDDRHRAGQGELELPLRMRAREPCLGRVDPGLRAQRPDHRRHQRLVAVVADAELHLAVEIDALDRLEEAVHEVLPRLLAVGDDVDAGVLLRLQPEERRVALRLGERRAVELPARPELVRLGEPAGFRQAAGDAWSRTGSYPHLQDVLVGRLRVHHVDALELDPAARPSCA